MRRMLWLVLGLLILIVALVAALGPGIWVRGEIVSRRRGLGRRAAWCGGGRGGGGCRRGVDGDGELDAAAKLVGERVSDKGAQPRLELLLDELVGCCDQRGVLDEP
jgi:hypothetical protein